MSDQHGTIHWSELATSDVAGSIAFFRTVAGWEVADMPMPNGTYHVCSVGGTPVAGIIDLKMTDTEGMPPCWTTYIAVEDVDKAVDQTEGGGGKVLAPPFDVPQVGRIAIIQDPGGATVGLITPAAAG